MPQPWLFNIWACNPYAAEPEREAALSQEALGVNFLTTPDQIVAQSLPGTDQANYSPEDWAISLTEVWPDVTNLIPESDHVFASDSDKVLAWVNKHRPEDKQRSELHCFDYAHYQLRKA